MKSNYRLWQTGFVISAIFVHIFGCTQPRNTQICYSRLEADVSINDKPIQGAHFYKSNEGTFLLKLNQNLQCDFYLLFPRLSQVATANPDFFRFDNEFAILSKPLVADALGVAPFDEDPQITLIPGGMAFNGIGRPAIRIRVKWQE